MRKFTYILMMVAVVAACQSGPAGETTTTGADTTTTGADTTTTEPGPTTTQQQVRVCPEAPFQFGFLPLGVGDPAFDPSGIEPDVWTSKGGTQTTLIGRSDGTVAIALIRGTLPTVDWPVNQDGVQEKQVLEVDGIEVVVGLPHADGTWVAAWALPPEERCDEYSMVFYPPWNSRDVEAVLRSMVRVPG